MKDIKDYLHLYLACECQVTTESAKFTGKMVGLYIDEWHNNIEKLSIQVLINETTKTLFTYQCENVKPILRPLESMTEDECDEVGCDIQNGEYVKDTITSDCTLGGHHHILQITTIADATKYLLSKHFDIFNLHTDGLCLYRNEKGELY